MRSVGRWVGALVVAAAVAVACGSGDPGTNGTFGSINGGGSGGGTPDGGTGSSGGSSGGSGGGGAADGGAGGSLGGGSGGGQDGGTGGTGATSLQTINFPNSPGWTFYGPQNGGPQDVYDAAYDEGGNLWVAGGSEGLFLLRAGATKLEKFGIADGLHPYGWIAGDVAKAMGVPDGSPADPSPSLTATPVISVAGGPAGTVFVGYQGKPGCEDEWDNHGATSTAEHAKNNAAIYKSGDADRVTLSGSGISVNHYDIFSGPNVVANELPGREKICSVYRIVWDKAKNAVWFGGNHGFAAAVADGISSPTCDGEPTCAVVWEHTHPAISGCSVDYDFATSYCPSDKTPWLTDGYLGLAVDPVSHDVWAGGTNRTTKMKAGSHDYSTAANEVEASPSSCWPNCIRWDLWPDNMPEYKPGYGVVYVSPSMRTQSKPYDLDDNVSGIAALNDGTAWVSSFSHGLIRIDSFGTRQADATAKLMTPYVSSLAYDPTGSVWAGMQWGGGITRMDLASGNVTNYSWGAPYDSNATLGDKLSQAPVANIQSAGSGSSRKMVASFHKVGIKDPVTKQITTYAGAVAVYKGQ